MTEITNNNWKLKITEIIIGMIKIIEMSEISIRDAEIIGTSYIITEKAGITEMIKKLTEITIKITKILHEMTE